MYALVALSFLASNLVTVSDFGDNPGNLEMNVFAPSDAAGLPVVIMLHGCAQTSSDVDDESGLLALAASTPFVFVAPRQRAVNNASLCFNWFLDDDVNADSGEAASIAAMIAHTHATFETDPARTFVIGLSAGAAMAVALMATSPERVSAGAIFAGGPYRCATNATAAFACMTGGSDVSDDELGDRVRDASDTRPLPRMSVWHGTNDVTVHPKSSDDLVRQWANAMNVSLDDGDTVLDGIVTTTTFGDAAAPSLVSVRVTGLGHAFPVVVDEDCGFLAPWFADVGICAAREALAFFGLNDVDAPIDDDDAGPEGGDTPFDDIFDASDGDTDSASCTHVTTSEGVPVDISLGAAGLWGVLFRRRRRVVGHEPLGALESDDDNKFQSVSLMFTFWLSPIPRSVSRSETNDGS